MWKVFDKQDALQRDYERAETPASVNETSKGYVICTTDATSDFYMPDVLHIQRDDSLAMYPNDAAAARAAEQDGVKLIYGMPHVPDGVYIDTPENRGAIERYFGQQFLYHSPDTDLIPNLHQRLDDNFTDYRFQTLQIEKDEIFGSAAEVASVTQSYEYFRNEHSFTTEQAEFLLKLQNPLELVSDAWFNNFGSLEDTVKAVFDNQERTLSSGSYELASGNPEAPPNIVSVQVKSNTPVSTGEKPSVMDEIRLAQKDMRERSAVPKEKSPHDLAARKKSEPDL
jgi:hypothetical protein